MVEPVRILVLGLGNVLLSDDGVGIAAIHRLEREWAMPAGVDVLDGGTLGLSLLSFVGDADHLILVDAVRAAAPPGTLLRLEGDEVPRAVATRLSPHQIGVADLLLGAALLDRYPKRVVLLGLVPGSLELGSGRTAEVAAAVPALVRAIVEELSGIGHPPEQRSEPGVGSDVATVLGL